MSCKLEGVEDENNTMKQKRILCCVKYDVSVFNECVIIQKTDKSLLFIFLLNGSTNINTTNIIGKYVHETQWNSTLNEAISSNYSKNRQIIAFYIFIKRINKHQYNKHHWKICTRNSME